MYRRRVSNPTFLRSERRDRFSSSSASSSPTFGADLRGLFLPKAASDEHRGGVFEGLDHLERILSV
jgi:hypothetical protein